MTWGYSRSFPRAIIHVDGDSFFASCEVAKNPHLRGKPVITGKERGIVSAMTYQVKARGVKRGMKLHEAKKLCPDAIILPSDYETYSIFSERMYAIVRRYTPAVEEYSIDECFADLTGLRRALGMSYEQMAEKIQRDLLVELGMTFSIGLSATKVLAKLGSRYKKPAGLTAIPLSEAPTFLARTPVEQIWGVGPNTAAYLQKYGIRSALDFAHKDETWVRRMLTKPTIEIWKELNGEVVQELDTIGRHTYQSISKTKTFTPPSTDPAFVYAQLSKNVENACIKARRWKLATPQIFFFLKTQDFKYHGYEIKLPHPSAAPQDLLRQIATYFPLVFRAGTQYRASGVVLLKLADNTSAQLDLFGAVEESEGFRQVFESVDAMSEKYGKHVLFLGSSFQAITNAAPARPGDPGRSGGHLSARGDLPERTRNLFKGETVRRRLNVPMMGEVV
ncbi:MAG TPA: DNA polymerase IV [Candidatus Paceibacterota bacterium]|nr:DNA polymerase IV [Candidatus Paceibacterota bacterium]